MKFAAQLFLAFLVAKKAHAAECPFNKIGSRLEEANTLAKSRLEKFEDDFPANTVGRDYLVGVENPNEVFCDGSSENKYCNKLHGEWGDSVPKDQGYCIWVVIEFQDPPEFNFCNSWPNPNKNTTSFLSMGGAEEDHFLKLPNVSDVIAAIGKSAGTHCGGNSAPWPVSSIIFKNGNSYAKDWVANLHRPVQSRGYDFGFVFRGHYKAFKCTDLDSAFNAFPSDRMVNGVYIMSDYGEHDDFRLLWNAYSSLKDLSPQFLNNDDGHCVLECAVGPCPVKETEASSSSTVAFCQALMVVTVAVALLGFV